MTEALKNWLEKVPYRNENVQNATFPTYLEYQHPEDVLSAFVNEVRSRKEELTLGDAFLQVVADFGLDGEK